MKKVNFKLNSMGLPVALEGELKTIKEGIAYIKAEFAIPMGDCKVIPEKKKKKKKKKKIKLGISDYPVKSKSVKPRKVPQKNEELLGVIKIIKNSSFLLNELYEYCGFFNIKISSNSKTMLKALNSFKSENWFYYEKFFKKVIGEEK